MRAVCPFHVRSSCAVVWWLAPVGDSQHDAEAGQYKWLVVFPH